MREAKSVVSTPKQPAVLPILFLSEMWERFGFYIVQGMLVLYLTQALGWSDDKSYTVSGVFAALVYISPIIGGYIADKILGFKIAIILGGILLALGYALLALVASQGEILLYLCLAVIIVGNGFFKPNIGSLLGTFYTENDPRREAGFTLFYMGINIGSMLGPLSAGYVKEAFGWPAAFGMASVGLVLGTINFLLGLKYLKTHGLPPVLVKDKSSLVNRLHSKTVVFLGIVLAIPVLVMILHEKGMASILLSVVAAGLIVALLRVAIKQTTTLARHKMFTLIVLTLIAVIFWAIWFQIFFSVNLFVERNVDRVVFGHEIPTVAFISLEAIFIVILSPFFARLWTRLGRLKKNPTIPTKFALSFIIMAVGFFILTLSTHFHHGDGLVNPWWIPVSYLLLTIGELFLSPIGLSAVTLLSPKQIVGMMMGVFLIAIGYGGKLAGVLAMLSSIPEGMTDKLLESQYYGSAFLKYALLSLVVGVILMLLVPQLKRFMKE